MSKENASLLVYVPTYNHGSYIGQCLESIVTQKLDIPFSVLVIDDCSTDDTAAVVRKYAAGYPHIVRAVLREQNIGVLQGQPHELDEYDPTYLALCEGDDFWQDDRKLQKQVDFLELHPECAICFHPVRVIYEDGTQPESIFPSPEQRFHKERLTIDDLLKENFIQTNSVLYRWRYGAVRGKIGDVFPKGILPGDWFIHLLHAEIGEIAFLDELMSVYRRHSNGLWTGVADGDPQFYQRNGLAILKFFYEMEQRFNVDYFSEKFSHVYRFIESCAKLGEFNRFQEIISLRKWIAPLKSSSKLPSIFSTKAFLRGAYYYCYAQHPNWIHQIKPRHRHHIIKNAIMQCLLRQDDKNFLRILFELYTMFKRTSSKESVGDLVNLQIPI